MAEFKMTIEGIPVPQLRPKISGGRMYDHAKVRNYKKLIAWQSKRLFKQKIFDGPIIVEIDIFRPIQKSDTKENKKLKAKNVIRPFVKPDISNYVKGIEDGMSGIIYTDDNQIVELKARKFYSETPRIEIMVKDL